MTPWVQATSAVTPLRPSADWRAPQRETSEVHDLSALGEAAVRVPDMRTLTALADGRTFVLVGAGSLDEKRELMERILND